MGWEEAEGGLRSDVDARPSSDTALTCRDKVVARRPLQGEAGAGERVIGVTREDGDPASKYKFTERDRRKGPPNGTETRYINQHKCTGTRYDIGIPNVVGP
jgi:hypothetical protein